jgi:hypothetical protein
MHATAEYLRTFINYLIPRCFRLAYDFLVVPQRVHRWSVAVVVSAIAVVTALFVRYAYVEKHHLADSFFLGQVKFSFIDGGYPEMLGYGLELAASVLFAMFAWTHLKKQWYAWSAILLLTFFDDSFGLHEFIGRSAHLYLGVAPVAGDLIGFASTGLLSAIFWFAGVHYIKDKEEFSAYLVFTGYYSLLIFFGVAVDAVHGLIGEHMSQTVFTLFEDGGELVTTALISLSSFGMWLRQSHTAERKNLSMGTAFPKM